MMLFQWRRKRLFHKSVRMNGGQLIVYGKHFTFCDAHRSVGMIIEADHITQNSRIYPQVV